MLFKKAKTQNQVEKRIKIARTMVRDLSEKDKEKLKECIDLLWQAEHVIKSMSASKDKFDEIDKIEKQLLKEAENE